MSKAKKIWHFQNIFCGLLAAMLIVGNFSQIFAHGGEDHGDEKPKTETTSQGTVSRVMRLGELEMMLKHPLLTPDQPTAAKLFITKFETNQGFADVVPTVELESANSSLVEAKIEKTKTAGIFNVSIPALADGVYTIRAKLAHGGEIDTASFSNVEIKPSAANAAHDEMSWTRTALIAFVFLIVLGLFGGLAYFVLKFNAGESFDEKAVSA